MDETTRQTIDVPIQPRSVRDLKIEVHKKSTRLHEMKIELEAKIKTKIEKTDSNAKTGENMQLFLAFLFFSQANETE